MMNNDSFFSFSGSFFDDAGKTITSHLEELLNAQTEGYDRVELNEEQIEKLIAAVRSGKIPESEIMLNPALSEIEIFASDPSYGGATTRVVFKPTVFPRKKKMTDLGDGKKNSLEPVADAYFFLNGNDEPDMIATLGVHTFYIPGHKPITGTCQTPVWTDAASLVFLCKADVIEEELRLMLRDIKFMYLGVQYAFLNRPEVFYESGSVRKGNPVPHKYPAPVYRKALLQKRILVNDHELGKLSPAPSKTMQCPCWGVMGHWRNYKSGRKIWIAPYKKGKNRTVPGAYSPKEYVMP